ncbi:MAG: L-rhamnose mutarotase [Dehalococcoidia bacterium]|tara:strand:- start:237 stop:590 length:354 start_codon:yes stop_codon:yes gene_type:complete
MSKSVAQVLDLKNDPQLIKEYEEWHKKVWPEVIAGIKESGIERMEIFRSGNHLFMYCLVADDFDPINDFPQQSKVNDKAIEWNKLMKKYQQKVPIAKENEWWSLMTLAFDSNWFNES